VASELHVDGLIRTQGGDATACSSGGGSGGSIWITTAALTTDGGYADGGNPHIFAHGGAGSSDYCGCAATFGGGGGAGGRIAIFADRNDLPAPWVTIAGGPGYGTGGAGNPGITMTYPGVDSLVTPVSPTDLDAGVTAGTTLQWTGFAPLGAGHFHVELDDDEHFDVTPNHPETGYPQLAAVNETAGTPGGPLTTTSWTTPALDAGVLYYWHVVVHNSGNGVIAGSPTWRFRTP
jgi:hypothetical protein